MSGAVELLGCLGRSSNRLRVLAAVADEPRGRSALGAETGIHRSTLSRALAELRRLELVRPAGDRYAATPLGSTIAARFAEVAGSIETAGRLQSTLRSPHAAGSSVRLADLVGGTLTLSTPSDPPAPRRRLTDLVAGGHRVGLLAPAILPGLFRGGPATGPARRAIDVIVPGDAVVDWRADRPGPAPDGPPERRPATRVYATDDSALPFAGYADDTAFVAVPADGGAIDGCLVTREGAVRSAVGGLVDHYRREAEPVPPGVLTP